MGGYEFVFKKGGVLQVGIKTLLSGGLRYTPADVNASVAAGIFVPDESLYYSEAGEIYFRLDTRFAYRKDHKNLSYTIALDIQNVTNSKNIRYMDWDRQTQNVKPKYQAGLLPVLSFQVDF